MPQLTPFLDDLPIPEVIKPSPGGPTSHHLTIAARPDHVRIHSEMPATTPVWSYRRLHGIVVRKGKGHSYLGPTIEVRRDEVVTVAWKNEIDDAHTLPFEVLKTNASPSDPFTQNEPGQHERHRRGRRSHAGQVARSRATLVTHLHGARVQADYDGWPDNTTIFGQSAHYTYHNGQAATMLWYHDHSMHVTPRTYSRDWRGPGSSETRRSTRCICPAGTTNSPSSSRTGTSISTRRQLQRRDSCTRPR